MLKIVKVSSLAIIALLVSACSTASPEPNLTAAPVVPDEPIIECVSDENTPVGIAGFEYKETVEDEYGCYVRIQLSSDNPLLTLDRTAFPLEGLESSGLTLAEVEQEYQFALNFFVSETLDSVGLDNRNAAREWFDSEEIQAFFTPDAVNSIEESLTESSLESLGLVLVNAVPEPGLREDVPRHQDVILEVIDVTVSLDDAGIPYVAVKVQGQTVLAFEDEAFSQWVLRNNSSVTEAQLRETNPELFDGENNNLILLTIESDITLQDSKIIGSSFYYETEIASGVTGS